jgi:hypothetical protein
MPTLKEEYDEYKRRRGVSFDAILREAELDRQSLDELMFDCYEAGSARSTELARQAGFAEGKARYDSLLTGLSGVVGRNYDTVQDLMDDLVETVTNITVGGS